MTVLQVCAYAAPYEGNFIKSLKALGKELEQQGHNMIYAFCENAKEIPWCRELAKTTDVYFLPLAKARIKPATYRTLKTIYQKHPDLAIVHSHFELYDVPVSLTAPKNVKVFWHLHDALAGYTGIKHKAVHKVQYGLLHKNAILLSVSQKHMEYVIDRGFPIDQARIVPNGLDTDRIRCVQTDPKKRTYDFLIFGWDFERKGVDLCVEAAQKLTGTPKIAVVGTDDTAEMIRERYGTVPGVEVVKPVADINGLYEQAGCFLHISRGEGLSYALLEAIYAGLPVICSDISENRFARVFDTVRMVANEDVDAIADAMNRQLANPVLEPQAVNSARLQIEETYTIACWVRNILSQYGVSND